MKRLFFAAATIAFLLCSYVAAAATITGVDVLEYGVYTYDEKVVVVEERHGATKLSNIRHLATTLEVPLRVNTFFGIKYVLRSPTPKAKVPVELHVTNPAGETSKGNMELFTENPTVTNIEFTEHDQPGEYLFQIMHGDEVLLSKTITFVNP